MTTYSLRFDLKYEDQKKRVRYKVKTKPQSPLIMAQDAVIKLFGPDVLVRATNDDLWVVYKNNEEIAQLDFAV